MKIFIEEQQEVNELLQTLESTGEYVGFERELLICPESGQKWEKYFFEFEDNSDGVGIRKYPVPSIEDVIEGSSVIYRI